MKEIFEVAGAILFSLGGGSVIIFALSSWLGKIWAQRIINKEEISNNYLLYSSQIQFNREYMIYSKLWLKLLNLKCNTLALMPILDYLPPDKEGIIKEYESRYKVFVDSLNEYHKQVYSNAPFISQEIYDGLIEIGKLCNQQGIEFSVYKLELDEDKRSHEQLQEYHDRDKILINKINKLTDELRIYLKKYKVK